MDNPTISVRIRRRESLPCRRVQYGNINGNGKSTTRTASKSTRTSSRTSSTSVLIGRRLGAAIRKNNPYVGSFRHAPPTSLRSLMEASSLPSSSLSSTSSSVLILPPSIAFAGRGGCVTGGGGSPTMKSSPYVGWFRHAPPSSRTRTKPVQHKVDPDSLLELDRRSCSWQHMNQLTSLLSSGVVLDKDECNGNGNGKNIIGCSPGPALVRPVLSPTGHQFE